MGLESASYTQLLRMNKTKRPDKYLEKASKFIEFASSMGVWIKVNILLFIGETLETISETTKWLDDHKKHIKGVSVGSLILFETKDKIKPAIDEFKNLGTSLSRPNPDDPEGVNRLNLSDEISFDVAGKYSSDICKMFMSEEDYFALKSFCYFPRDYKYIDYQADIASSASLL